MSGGNAGGLEPWWLTIAGGIVAALVGAIGKLWSENRSLRTELAAARAELADALEHNAELQADAFREHRRDLRVLAGLPTSGAPPALALDPLRPPVLIRPAPPKRPRNGKKPRD